MGGAVGSSYVEGCDVVYIVGYNSIFYKRADMTVQGGSSPRQEEENLFIWPPFLQYNKLLLRQKTGGACLYMPQDGHCLASLKLYPPLKKKLVFRGQKNEIIPRH